MLEGRLLLILLRYCIDKNVIILELDYMISVGAHIIHITSTLNEWRDMWFVAKYGVLYLEIVICFSLIQVHILLVELNTHTLCENILGAVGSYFCCGIYGVSRG